MHESGCFYFLTGKMVFGLRGREKLLYIGHIGICRPKGYGFWPENGGVYILPILVWNRVWFSRELRERVNLVIVSIPNE